MATGPKPGVLLYGRTVAGINVPVLVDATGLLAGGGNPFDQDLNTTDDVTFDAITATSLTASGAVQGASGVITGSSFTVAGRKVVQSVGGSHTPAGNSTNTLTTVYDFTIPAGLLANDGDALEIETAIVMANNGATKSHFLIFGSTQLSGISAASTNLKRIVKATVMRTGATTQIASSQSLEAGSLSTDVATPAETLSGVVHVFLKLIATSTNDMIAQYLLIRYIPAGTQI